MNTNYEAIEPRRDEVDALPGATLLEFGSPWCGYCRMEIRAPFSGRTGIINVRAGSLVQPGAANAAATVGGATTGAIPLVTVTQVDPISVTFTLPEKELAGLQEAMRRAPVIATATPQSGGESFRGRVTFIDNAVDTTTGTIRLKAEFDNPQSKLWPGMYVNVAISPRTIEKATVVPAQAVQTSPDSRFVYVVGGENKVVARTVKLAYVEQGFAVVEGIQPGARVVIEGAQNLRPGSAVAEAERQSPVESAEGDKSERKGGKRKAANPA